MTATGGPVDTANSTADPDVYRVHLIGGVASVAETLGTLAEQGWHLVSIDLRDDADGVHTITVRPAPRRSPAHRIKQTAQQQVPPPRDGSNR